MHMDSEQETFANCRRDRARAKAFAMLEPKIHEVYGLARVLELASDSALAPGASSRDLNAFGNCVSKLRHMAEELLNGYDAAHCTGTEQVG